ncbi:hypothetical protein [Enterobacter sp. WCHEn045836]|uniref:hypothetical protein n=1 Tax=Enterobacter sp. WCHEn045836 TaxID=2497434 RepID=UPI0039171E1B
MGYLSAHATSPPIGDLCEYLAIREVFGSTSHLSVFAIKSAFGHLQGAAGELRALISSYCRRIASKERDAVQNTRDLNP